MQKKSYKRHEKENEIISLADRGATFKDIAAQTGVGGRQVRHIIERYRIAEEARAEPLIDRDELSLTAQRKLDAAMRQHQRQLDREFADAVRIRVKDNVSHWLAYYKERLAHADEVAKARRGVMPRKTYRKILACLHPDRSMSDETLRDAFSAFEKLERVLVSEAEMPTPASDWPSSYEELMELKRKTTEARRARRRNGANVAQR